MALEYPTEAVRQWVALSDALHAENERLREMAKQDRLAFDLERDRADRLQAALVEISELDLEGDASLDDAIHIADEALNPPL